MSTVKPKSTLKLATTPFFEDDAEIISQLNEESLKMLSEKLVFPTKEEYSKMIDELLADHPTFEEILRDMEESDAKAVTHKTLE